MVEHYFFTDIFNTSQTPEQTQNLFYSLVSKFNELGLKLLGDTLGRDYNLYQNLDKSTQIVYMSLENYLFSC